jgi:hypothetical protein
MSASFVENPYSSGTFTSSLEFYAETASTGAFKGCSGKATAQDSERRRIPKCSRIPLNFLYHTRDACLICENSQSEGSHRISHNSDKEDSKQRSDL